VKNLLWTLLTNDPKTSRDAQDNRYFARAIAIAGDLLRPDIPPNPNEPPPPAMMRVSPVCSSSIPIQPGSWASIYGTSLSKDTATWNGDFPTSLAGVSVTVDNKPAYLWYVSPAQINFQAPDGAATGPVTVAVTTALGRSTANVTLAQVSPCFSVLGDGKHAAAIIPTPGGTGAYGGGTYDLAGPPGAFAFRTRPVKQGETLILYGVGFGPTNPPVPAGQAFSGAAPTVNPVSITIGGAKADVAFAGITAAGLYQFNITVPNVVGGDLPLRASVGGVQTPAGPLVTVLPPPVTLLDHVTSDSNGTSGGCHTPRLISVYSADAGYVYLYFAVNGAATGDTVHADFYRPDGTLHQSVKFGSLGAVGSQGFVCFSGTIAISGTPVPGVAQAAGFPGQWTIRTFWNRSGDAELFDLNFVITPAASTTAPGMDNRTTADSSVAPTRPIVRPAPPKARFWRIVGEHQF
jgi:uncharacterized protein (TIGR03437 family)